MWHKVSPVMHHFENSKHNKRGKPHRFAVTGWYRASNDKIDQDYLNECNNMIGSDSDSTCTNILFDD